MREMGKDSKAPIVARRRIEIILKFGEAKSVESSPRSAVDVEDRTPAAFAANEPIPLPRVAQAEGSAAYLSARHGNGATRAEWHPSRCELFAYLLQFARGVLRQTFVSRRIFARAFRAIVVRHQSGILTTIFPNCCPLWSRSNA
jgi:hypothetical protein